MKALNFIKKELRESLLKGVNKTIDSLKDILPIDGEKYQNLLLLEMRLKEVNTKVMNGTISEEQKQLATNKIREGLIQLINDLKDNDLSDSRQINIERKVREPAGFERSKRRENKDAPLLSKNVLIGLISILLIVVVWAVSSQFSPEPVAVTPDPVPGSEIAAKPEPIEEVVPPATKPAAVTDASSGATDSNYEAPPATEPELKPKDQDGNQYQTNVIDGKLWLAENLAFNTANSWDFNGVSSQKRGKLYSWDAARSACQSLGPEWRLPSISEWESIARKYPDRIDLLEGGDSGLNLITGGCRSSKQEFINGETAYYWTNDAEGSSASFFTLGNGDIRTFDKSWGFSCRCLKDI